jgi:hypothetical protein
MPFTPFKKGGGKAKVGPAKRDKPKSGTAKLPSEAPKGNPFTKKTRRSPF